MPAGALFGRVLRAGGIGACYGEPFGALAVTPVPATLAERFADAHGRVTGRPAAAHRGAGRWRLPGGSPGTPAAVLRLDGPGDLPDLLDVLGTAPVELHLELDPGEPAPDVTPTPRGAPGWVDPPAEAVDRLRHAAAPVVLAGPDVVRLGAVPALHDLAAVGNLGVLNTWGAKGVFDWRSRHHLATVGLQAGDFTLAGLAGNDLVVTSGLDEREAGRGRWRLAPSTDVAPHALGPLAEALAAAGGRRVGPIDPPPLRPALAAVTQGGWRRSAAPLAPSRVTRAYAELVGPGGLVAADAGTAGYWVARTFPTAGLGSAVVPAGDEPGLAVAAVAVAGLHQPGRLALAVVDAPLHPAVVEALAVAGTWGVAVPVEVWDPGGEHLDAAGHAERLGRLLVGAEEAVATLATDPDQLVEMEAVAGPVVAWRS